MKRINHFKRMYEGKTYALTIDGPTLFNVFNYNLEILFREVCMSCVAVLCCRMSPAQKAQVLFLICLKQIT